MELLKIIERLKDIGPHSSLTLYGDGSGLLNFDFTCKTSDMEAAVGSPQHLKQILDKVKKK